MRFQGRLRNWKDAQGYGFVAPEDGGEQAFVHIKAFRPGGRRPQEGDMILYRTEQDAQGRLQAVDIAYPAAPRSARVARTLPLPWWLGVLWCVTVVLLAAYAALPRAFLWLEAGTSLVCYLLYYFDKAASLKNRWRTPERTLQLWALAGGWPGALLAQRQFRHKTVKQEFQGVFKAAVLCNVLGVLYLLTPSGQALLAGA